MKLDEDAAAVNILFVCLGNICRSPMAEGLLRHMVRQTGLRNRFIIDSAGLGSWHVGHPPDERAQGALAARGVQIADLRARQVTSTDFETFDVILAMDRSNRQALIKLSPVNQQHKIRLLMEYAPNLGVREIPDPFFGGCKGFEYVAQMIEAGCRGVLQSYLPQSQLMSSSGPSAPPKG
jgi:protein-tyrosine phosphatase